MNLNITLTIFDENNSEIKVFYNKHQLLISKDSNKWNTEGINEFLINVATSIPENEKINVVFDQEARKNNATYRYICELFEEFSNEYNKMILAQ